MKLHSLLKQPIASYYKGGWTVIACVIAILYMRYGMIMILRDSSIIMDIVLYITVLFAIFFRRHYNWKIIAILGFFIVLSVLNPASKNIFLILLTVYFLSPLSLSQIAKINLTFQILVIIWILVLVIDGDILVANYSNTYELDERSNRWDFGFGNPNVCALFVYAIILNYSVILNNSKVLSFVITTFLTIIITYYTGSRSFQMSMYIYLLCFIGINSKKIRELILKFKPLLYCIPILCMVGTYYFSVNASEFPEINLLLSGRLQLYYSIFTGSSCLQYLIGNPDVMEELIDSGYVHLLFEGGVFAFIVFYWLYVNYINKLTYKTITYLPIILSALIYSLTESVLTSILNYGVIIVWSILYKVWTKNIKYGNTKNHSLLLVRRKGTS